MAKETAKAKKERLVEEAKNGVTPVVLSADQIKEVEQNLEPSGELVPIGNEFGTAVGIADDKVNKYLLAFTPYVQGVIDLEEEFKKINFEEPSEEDVKLAKELKVPITYFFTDVSLNPNESLSDLQVKIRALQDELAKSKEELEVTKNTLIAYVQSKLGINKKD